MVKEGSVDKKSFQAIDGIVAEASSDASKRQVGENSQFNHHNYYNGIRNKIVKEGNLRSLATNTNSFGRVFKKDLEESNANLKPEVARDFSWTQSFEEAKARATKRFGNGKNFTYQEQRFTTDAPMQEVSEDEFA